MPTLLDRTDPPVYGPQDFPACFATETARTLPAGHFPDSYGFEARATAALLWATLRV